MNPGTRRRGFTLIEILMVVAVISLLSSVVLVSVNSAREKTRNAARLRILNEYRSALELARAQTGAYPRSGGSCLGTYPSGTCMGSLTPSPTVAAALAPYLSPSTPPLIQGQYQYVSGLVYYTCPEGGGGCSAYSIPTDSYAIYWYQEGAGASCGIAKDQSLPVETAAGLTYCQYVHY